MRVLRDVTIALAVEDMVARLEKSTLTMSAKADSGVESSEALCYASLIEYTKCGGQTVR